MPTAGEVRDLLDERPDLEPAVEAVLDPEPPFTFDDVAIDSGAFGELVARGVVEKTDQGYRVPDPDAIRRALAGDVPDGHAERPAVSLPALPVTRLELTFLAGALAIVVGLRLLSLPNVYHGGHVVLSSNDPYYYRALAERVLADPSVTPSTLPAAVAKGEPLYVASLWLVTKAFGGSKAALGQLMAWAPVVSAIISAVFLYATAVVVTEDRRIGLASVVMLAIIPAHALRTSFGLADHSPFDYIWLSLTLFALVLLAADADRWEPWPPARTIGATATLAVAFAAQTLAWDNSPILLAATALYLGMEGLRSVAGDQPPYRTLGPGIVGVGGGAALAWVGHSSLGWHTTLVASAPALVAIGGLGVLAAATLVVTLDFPRFGGEEGASDASPLAMLGLEAVGLGAGLWLLQAIKPAYWTRLTTSLQHRLLARRAIAETVGLFSDAGGWLLLLGFALFVGVPYLVWASGRSIRDARWLPAVAFAWYFLALAVMEVRFVGELAIPLALFVGLGLVHLAERIDAARPPNPFTSDDPSGLALPTRRQVGALVALFLLVGSLGLVQVPIKIGQTATPTAQSDAAFWMAHYSQERNLTYPGDYVFSRWGWNRMYNYFVNGESRSYGYAQSNFHRFVNATDPGGWYQKLGHRRGFVVTSEDAVGRPDQIGTRLQRDNGAGSATTSALAHYRLVHVTGGGRYKVFTVVPGAVIKGTTAPNATVTASTDVAVQDISFTYARTGTANAKGEYAIRVAQPGTYHVGNTSVAVNVSAVRKGLSVSP